MIALVILFLEIMGILVLGEFLGLGGALIWIVVSFIAGVAIMRYEGLNYLRHMMEDKPADRHQRMESVIEDGMMPVVGGLMLVLPGVFTDIFGLLLIIPPVRRLWIRFLNYRGEINIRNTKEGRRIIEGEYKRKDK